MYIEESRKVGQLLGAVRKNSKGAGKHKKDERGVNSGKTIKNGEGKKKEKKKAEVGLKPVGGASVRVPTRL